LKTKLILAALFLVTLICRADDKNIPIYKDPSKSIEKRLDDLIGRMTLNEKLIQIGGHFRDQPELNKKLGTSSFGFMNNVLSPSDATREYNSRQKNQIENTRLGIPAFRSAEGIFAYMGNGSTSFPQPIAQAATFDPDCVAEVARILAKEMKSRGISEVLSPVLNLTRDPRWGRANETYGEDPYLIGKMGAAYVKEAEAAGIQSDIKHFVANMGLNGQFGGPTYFTERIMREYYFPAFKTCFEAGASSVMMAYNTFDAIPCATNKWLITDIIKNEWKVPGFVRSDGGAAQFIYDDGGIHATPEELVIDMMNAGCDKASPGWFFGQPLKNAVQQGLVTESRIDEAVRRIVRQKMQAGLFEDPYVEPEKAEEVNNAPEHRRKSLEICRKSLVLLKNENKTLPFSKDVRDVAVVGPLADWLMVGHYGGFGRHEVTMVEGVKKLLPAAKVHYEKGVEMKYFAYPAIDQNDFVGKVKAEYFDNIDLYGKPKYTRQEEEIKYDWKAGSPEGLPDDKFSVRWTGKFKSPVSGPVKFGLTIDDGARLWLNGKLVIDEWSGGARRLAETEVQMEKGQVYDFKMEYFDEGFKAYAQLGWNVDLEENIPSAIAAAKKSDVIIAVMGMYENENWDRADLDLAVEQEKMIIELAKLDRPMVVVLQSGSVITMYDWIDKVDAVLVSWYPGCEGGNAIAQTIFGDYNPGGKLPITFPKVTGQVPMPYNKLPKGKMAIKFIGDFNEPLFLFGYGISYTDFAYSDLKLSKSAIEKDENLKLSFNVKNVGNSKGDEVPQLYIKDVYASVAQPHQELKDFERISLNPGESKKVEFTLTPEKLKIWSINEKWEVEPGDFEVMIGSSSSDIRLEDNFQVLE
jgi:beta-glucosidase